MTDNETIYVTKPFLPPRREFDRYVDKIWDSGILTNNGSLVEELEDKLSNFLKVPFVNIFNNCTNGLMASFPLLGIEKGEVITTPYTFVATAHSIAWNNLTPVFVDIDPDSLNICPKKIEQSITDKTKAIMAVHCYGRPCDVSAIDRIAKKYKLKVIYDAAHAFHVSDDGGSILRHGDLSVLSFHATKVFNTFEGGAIVSHSKEMFDKIRRFQNFGIVDEQNVEAIGMNGKQSEVHAAMGLSILPYVEKIILDRQKIYDEYCALLLKVDDIILPEYSDIFQHNYAYFPVIINGGEDVRNKLHDYLKDHGIIARKYFYPNIFDFSIYSEFWRNCPVSKKMAETVLCLPIYPNLSHENIKRVSNAILDFFSKSV